MGNREKKPYDQTSVYVLSKAIDSAQKVAQYRGGQWRIENNLHWVKDAVMKEDAMPAKLANLASQIALFNIIIYYESISSSPTKNLFPFLPIKCTESISFSHHPFK